jgi:hypothetical protein
LVMERSTVQSCLAAPFFKIRPPRLRPFSANDLAFPAVCGGTVEMAN